MAPIVWVALVLGSGPGSSAADVTAASPAVSSPVLVTKIDFEGLSSRKPEELTGRLSTKVGQAYNPLSLREDITGLASTMRSVKARTEPTSDGGVQVIFQVEEFPRLQEFQVIGNQRLSTERIKTLSRLKESDVVDESTVRSLRKALQDEYRKIGMSDTKIDVNVAAAQPPGEAALPAEDKTKANVQVIISEGESIKIDDLIIQGNKVFTALRLRAQLETKGSWLFLKNYYDDSAFQSDLGTLRAFYVAHGYFDARIERGTFEARREKGKLVITPVIQISEGEKYTLDSVEVRGARLFSPHEVEEPFKKLLGKEFSGKSFGKALEEAQNLYLDSGFLTTKLNADYDYESASHSLKVVLQIKEEPRIYVGEIKVERPAPEPPEKQSWFRKLYDRVAPPVSNEAILREVVLKPGEVYSKERERQTVRRLEGMGIFSKVEAVNQPTQNARVQDALIKIQESGTGGFFAGVGFGDVSGAFVYFSFQERNLFGEARDFTARVQLGTRASSFNIAYVDRHFRDTDDIFSTSLYYNRFVRPGWLENVGGTQTELTHRLYSEWDVSVRSRLEWASLSKLEGYHPAEDLDVSYPVVTGKLRFSQNSLYPATRPTEGRKLEGGVEVGYGGGPLLKFTGEADYLYKLSERYTYRFNPSAGLIPYDSDVVGLTERLFLGGGEDLRGFQYMGAGRRDRKDDRVPTGGAVKLLARNEFGFPVYDPVSGVYFVDVGTIGKNPLNYEVPRLSTGLGLRLNLPKATVAIDFALPLIKEKGDQTQFFHFSFKGSL